MRDYPALLRSHGLRNTPHRRAVLLALEHRPHSTVSEVADGIAQDGEGAGPAVAVTELSRQGLYNILEDLRRVGLLRSIEPAGSPARFELQTFDNHHHLVCRGCGTVRDVACAVGRAPCLEPVNEEGFTIDEAEVMWWGLCGACTRAGVPDTGPV